MLFIDHSGFPKPWQCRGTGLLLNSPRALGSSRRWVPPSPSAAGFALLGYWVWGGNIQEGSLKIKAFLFL